MTRLLCFLSFFVSSYITVKHVNPENLSDVLLTFGGIYALGYIGGRLGDAFAGRFNEKTSKSKKEEEDAEDNN